jgi:hypothetical protein
MILSRLEGRFIWLGGESNGVKMGLEALQRQRVGDENSGLNENLSNSKGSFR